MVSLRPIDASNREAVEVLRVSPAQERFVSDVAESLQEAADEPGGRAQYWAIYDGETPVVFGRGFGTATLDLIVDRFRERPGVEVMSTSAGQGPGSPIPFYERYGFERTGDIVFDDEVLLRLRLR